MIEDYHPSGERQKAYSEAHAKDSIHPVGEIKPNPWGLYDMLGNVWERVEDLKRPYRIESETDPVGPKSGAGRVLRGGAFLSNVDYCRCSYRYGGDPDFRYDDVGFRLVLRPFPSDR